MSNLSKNRYRELKYFCLQYAEKKRELRELSYISGMNYDGMPKGNATSDPTANTATKAAILSKDTELIEQTALEVGESFYQELIDNVTKEAPWEYLDIPMSRRSFYRMRERYFNKLSEKLAQT